jgi:hypothetical protein
VAVVAVGLYTVWQRIEAVSAGYRVSELQNLAYKLQEDNRQLSMEIQRMTSTYELIAAADRMGIHLESYTPMKLEDQLPSNFLENPEDKKEEPRSDVQSDDEAKTAANPNGGATNE